MPIFNQRNPDLNGPTLPSKRIIALDALRGLAIMGILFGNIQISSMIEIAEFNPAAFGDLNGINYLIAMLTHILVNRKFYTIFTMLFGAGIVLMADRIESRNQKPFKRHYPRMFWLFIIGSMNHYLFTRGEILAYYALCGLVAFLCRKLSPRKLLIYGLLMLFLVTAFDGIYQATIGYRSEENLKTIEEYFWKPNQEMIDAEIARTRAPWISQIKHRIKSRRWFLRADFYYLTLFSFLGRMLLGMALFKWGILTARAGKKTYQKILFYAGMSGLIISILSWVLNSVYKWDIKYSLCLGYQVTVWGGILLASGYIAGLMLICQAGRLKRFINGLASVGRMALTNYLMQGIICFFIFSRPGLGLCGRVERSGQFLIVLAILIFQYGYSGLWLKRFRFGPAEWLWRTLTYWKIQPLRKKESG